MTSPTKTYTLDDIDSVELKVGLEIHVQLATRRKMFSGAPSASHPEAEEAEPNTLIDPTVLGLPGALPVMNRGAIEMSMMVGFALGCSIADRTKWDRKSYFYPDLPKAYQISQYDMPICFDGQVEIPRPNEKGEADPTKPFKQIGIIRAHLEEDSGKLLHEAPGGRPIDFSIVDLNRAGTPLLEVVTQPDFTSADEALIFARQLRNICRFLGVSEGVMQKGHMRFEPNINVHITMHDKRLVKTPIVEVKNLNSFRALRAAIEYERERQPGRWLEDGREMGAGMKVTRGWDDVRGVTLVQREKEDAHDYRYFPDPDLLPVEIDEAWKEKVRSRVPELPLDRFRRYIEDYDLTTKEAAALVDEREVCFYFEDCVSEIIDRGIVGGIAGRMAANLLLQSGAKRANERGVLISELGIEPWQVAEIARMRHKEVVSSSAGDKLFGFMCEEGHRGMEPEALANLKNLVMVRDDAALEAWCDQVIDENMPIVEQIKGGKVTAVGRLVGNVMKLSGGSADPKAVRRTLLEKLDVEED